MAWDIPDINIAAGGQLAANRVANLFDDFQSGLQAGDQQRVRGARRSLADLGTGPDGKFDPQLASQRLMAAGDIQGARTLADLGMAEEDRKFRQMQYQQGQQTAADNRTYERGRDQVRDQQFDRTLSARTSTQEVRAPQVTEIYDQATGAPRKAQWNGSEWVPIGGTRAPTATRPPPAAVLSAVNEDLEAIQGINTINGALGQVGGQIQSGKLLLGPADNLISRGLNATGISTENSRNFASFQATLEKLRNESLRLNKGVQTEGDSERAWNELVANINDPKVVSQRINEIVALNKKAAGFRSARIQQNRQDYGLPQMDIERIAPSTTGAPTQQQSNPGYTGARPSQMGAGPANAAPYSPPLTTPGANVNTDRAPQGSVAPGVEIQRALAAVPPTAIQALVNNPTLRDQFEAKYGPGTAGAILGQ